MPLVISPASAPTFTNQILVGGQSLAQIMSREDSGYAMAVELALQAVSPTYTNAYASLINVARGGASICKTLNQAELNAIDPLDPDPPTASNYWWDDQMDAPGVNCTLAAATLASISPLPIHIVWDQGQADAGALGGAFVSQGITAAAAQALYSDSYDKTLLYLQTACNSGSPTDVMVGTMLLGRQVTSNQYVIAGFDPLRQIQLQKIADTPTQFFKAGECYDISLRDSIHYNFGAAGRTYGKRMARALARAAFSNTDLLAGPSITGTTLIDSTHVQVNINVEATDSLGSLTSATKPTAPCGFRFEDSAVPGAQILASSWAWNGNNLIATLTAPITSGVILKFPYGSVPDFDYTQVIYGQMSEMPLASYLQP